MDERASTKNVRHETLFGRIDPPGVGGPVLEIPLLWRSVATAATTEIKTDMKSWEPETTPLCKVLGTSFSKGLAKLHGVGRRRSVRHSVF